MQIAHTVRLYAVQRLGFDTQHAKPVLSVVEGDALDKILIYHVVPGRFDSTMLDQQIVNGGGKAVLKTVQGAPLTVQGSGKNLTVTDEKGGTAHVTIRDVYQSNGVIQVVDRVLLPN